MSRRAKLGFVYHGMPDELKVTTPEDRQKTREDLAYEANMRHTRSKLEWWHRNKERLNAARRSDARSISQKYKVAKAKAGDRSQDWDFTQEEWERKWMEAGWVNIPNTDTIVPAFALRGCHAYNSTYMRRIDTSKGWSYDNTEVVFRDKPLGDGSESPWYRAAPS